MFQKSKPFKISTRLALAAAGGIAFSSVAMASETRCQLENGYATNLSAYVSEATVCVEQSNAFQSAIAERLLEEMNAERRSEGLAPLVQRPSLDMAAKAHALDMSTRIYADHLDLEGRDHLHRIRAFDRTMLVGASGSNVTVSPATGDAKSAYRSIKWDRFNVDNMMRDRFTDVGIGVVETAGQYYIVQVFASAEGDLEHALPVTADGSTPLSAKLAHRNQRVLAWGLMDTDSGEMLAGGSVPRVRFTRLGEANAELDVLVGVRNDTHVLKGPLVAGQN